MNSHTPAPWHARQVHVDGFITHVVSLDADPVEDEYHYGRNIAKDLSGNNAALIAAAPELLDTCEIARALIRSFDEAHPGGFLVGVALLSLDNAIAKARSQK